MALFNLKTVGTRVNSKIKISMGMALSSIGMVPNMLENS